jgi:hypothetical protein
MQYCQITLINKFLFTTFFIILKIYNKKGAIKSRPSLVNE